MVSVEHRLPKCPHMAEGTERKGQFSSSSYKDTNPIIRAPLTLPKYLPNAPPPNTVKVGIQHMKLGPGDTNIHVIAG